MSEIRPQWEKAIRALLDKRGFLGSGDIADAFIEEAWRRQISPHEISTLIDRFEERELLQALANKARRANEVT